MQKFVFDSKGTIKEPMHRRVNSNVIDMASKPISFHRRTLSNTDLKISPVNLNVGTHKSKPLILPDSLNSSAIQPCLLEENHTFIDVLEQSIKHFSSSNPTINPLKQLSDLKSQIAYYTKNIETLKENRSQLTQKSNTLKGKSFEAKQENNKLYEYISQIEKNTEKLKSSLEKSELELKALKRENQQYSGPSTPPLRRETRAQTLLKQEACTNSSNDEIDVFNAEENTCMPYSDPFQFANASPRIPNKNLYQRMQLKK